MSVQRETKIVLRDDLDDSALVVQRLDPLATSDDDTRIVSFSGDTTWVTWATLREFAQALLDLLPDEEQAWDVPVPTGLWPAVSSENRVLFLRIKGSSGMARFVWDGVESPPF